MIDAKQASQLLKSNWRNVAELAQQIVSLARSRAPRTIEAPVTIRVPAGQTALRVVPLEESPATYRAAPEGPAPRPRQQQPEQRAESAVRSPEIEASRLPSPQPNDFVRTAPAASFFVSPSTSSEPPPLGLTADLGTASLSPRTSEFIDRTVVSARPPAPREIRSAAIATQSSFAPTARPFSTKPTLDKISQSPRSRPRPPDLAPVPSLKPSASGLLLPPETPIFAKKYEAPIVEVVGPAFFGGELPVQFTRPPVVYNPKTKNYEPILDRDDTESLTAIPRGAHLTWGTLGKVVSGTGETWRVTIYPDGPPATGTGASSPATEDVDVICLGAGPNFTAPVGKWIGPIGAFPNPGDGDDIYVYQPSWWAMGRIMKTGAGGIPAMAANIPGKSTTCTLYTFNGASALAIDVTGVTCYHLGSLPVGGNKFIQSKTIEGKYFADFEDC